MSGVGSPMTTTSTPAPTPISAPVMAGSQRSQRSAKNNNIRNHNYSPSSSDTSSLGASAHLNCASSSCSSGSKDQERATLSNGVVRHQSMWSGTTHNNIAQEKSGRADGAIQVRSERMSYYFTTPPSLSSSSLSFHCSPSHYNLVSLTSLSPPSPSLTTIYHICEG